MPRHVCIHGHFYQPPRENPWLEEIELQRSAAPFHDWNERITAECYAPNATARILDEDGWIRCIVNNYSRISFNFGPTLLSDLETRAPATYRAILRADRDSAKRYGGRGSAVAQAYGHAILPLCNARDRRSQVVWGRRDFEHRFGRRPEGMWLPETAVDVASLEALAEAGIRFTILEPGQAARFRKTGETRWTETGPTPVATDRAYVHRLPSGRSIAVFFYDGAVSRAVAFDRLLDNGDRFADRMFAACDADPSKQMVSIATDGETYGHHHKYGDMALAYALDRIGSDASYRLTNFAAHLDAFPPTHEVEVRENTSWSCAHGIERWRSDCGCHSGARLQWNQQWRAGLRQALEWLRDRTAALYEEYAGRLLNDPWLARDDYIDVLLDESPAARSHWIERYARQPLDHDDRVATWQLLEMQRSALLMFTSCGWFFDDLGGIETVQILRYAGRVAQLAADVSGVDLEPGLLERLEGIESNVATKGTGRQIYLRSVKSAMMDLRAVAGHFAARLAARSDDGKASVYGFRVETVEKHAAAADNGLLITGRVRVISPRTEQEEEFAFAAIRPGDGEITAGARRHDEESYATMIDDLGRTWTDGDAGRTVSRMRDHFSGSTISFDSLRPDTRSEILESRLGVTVEQTLDSFRRLEQRHAPLRRRLAALGEPCPSLLRSTTGFLIGSRLIDAVRSPELDIDRVRKLLVRVREEAATVDREELAREIRRALERATDRMLAEASDPAALERMAATVKLVRKLPCDADLWPVENGFFELVREQERPRLARTPAGGEHRRWLDAYADLAALLRIRIE